MKFIMMFVCAVMMTACGTMRSALKEPEFQFREVATVEVKVPHQVGLEELLMFYDGADNNITYDNFPPQRRTKDPNTFVVNLLEVSAAGCCRNGLFEAIYEEGYDFLNANELLELGLELEGGYPPILTRGQSAHRSGGPDDLLVLDGYNTYQGDTLRTVELYDQEEVDADDWEFHWLIAVVKR